MLWRWRENIPCLGRYHEAVLILWQFPLVLVFAIDPGPYVLLCWIASLLLMAVQRWRWMLLLLGLSLLYLHMIFPAPRVEFFIGMLIMILPLSWQSGDHRPLSPGGLAPTIFLVGTVFIFHVQFFLLMLLIVWLLSFLLWFSMIYAGWSFREIRIHWWRLLSLAFSISFIVVLIFALVPRINIGATPFLAHVQKQIRLTDQLTAEGFSNLLADDTIAFRAFPQDDVPSLTPYWRVFALDQQNENGWSRGERKSEKTIKMLSLDAPYRSFQILADRHDLGYLPVPGWPAHLGDDEYYLTPFAELENRSSSHQHATVKAYDVMVEISLDPRPWQGSTHLGDEGRLAKWAKDKRQKMSSDRDFANFLMANFRQNYAYSLTSSYVAGTSSQVLDSFFFKGKSGHCSLYAQALATAFRAAGIKANVVTGYLGGEWNSYGRYWIVRNNMAHAWVEARLDGGAWQRFDPSAMVSVSVAEQVAQLDFGQELLKTRPKTRQNPFWVETVYWIDSLNTRVTHMILQYDASPVKTLFKRFPGLDFVALFWILAGLMISGSLVAIMLIGVRVLFSGLHFISHPDQGRRLEGQLEHLLMQVASPRQAGEGLIDYAERSCVNWPERLKAQTCSLARRIYFIRFNPEPATRDRLKNLKRDIKMHRFLLQSIIDQQRNDERGSQKISVPYFPR
ncbi:transglutaminaseTgpA domain-containing protein [Alphaproteobacteria bacterium LSUCC0684]